MKQRSVRPEWYPEYTAEHFAADWVRMIGKARDDAVHTDRYHEIHYEDLVREPASTLQRLTSFLDEPWDPRVMEHNRTHHDFSERELSTVDVQKPVYLSAVGAWRTALSAQTLSAIMGVSGFARLLQKEGYATVDSAANEKLTA